MFGFFKRSKASKPRAMVFVDFEHWYISLSKMHGARPEIKAWHSELAKRYDIQDILFFGDFSNSSLQREIPKIREITNSIIETGNTSSSYKKDFTDFIMLDSIYQKAISSPDTDTFILFSGDGHFSSVCSYLVSKLHREVGIYAVRGALSNQLRNIASWTELVPDIVDPHLENYRLILKNLKYLRERSDKPTYPTFWGTVEAVSRVNRVKRKPIAEALRAMIEKGYASQAAVKLPDGKSIQVLKVNYKKCRADGITED